MSILNRVKQLVGMGVELEVEVPYKYLTPGSQLTYQITLTSEADVTIRSLTIDVIGGSAAPGAPGWGSGAPTLSEPPIEEIEIEAEKPWHHSGSLTLPDDAPLSVNDSEAPYYWALRVVADLPLGVDPSVVVGFVVGPKTRFEWSFAEPMPLGVAGSRRDVRVAGTCTVVHSPELNVEATQETVRGMLPEALADLLREYPDLQGAGPADEQRLGRLSNELREIINPLIRESANLSLDSVAELTIQTLEVK